MQYTYIMKKYSFIFALIISFFYISCSSDSYNIFLTTTEPDTINIENIVIPNSADKYPELTAPVNKDWLVLFYIGADSYVNDELYLQMAQIGRGLRSIMRYDGQTFKKDFSKVTAVALWDGFNTDGSYTPKFYLPNTYLFEFKYPEQKSTIEIADDYRNFTINHSDEVLKSNDNWLTINQEVNSADGDTLKKFIAWTQNKYNSDNSKEVILVISGMGGGSFGTETGTYIPPSSRATSRDYSSESYYLSAPQIKIALEANGFNSSNKLKLLIIDSAFSASLEDAFELRNNVASMIASPSDVPDGGIDFNYFLQSLRKNTSIYNIGSETVNVYANRNYNYNKERNYSYNTKFMKNMASLSFYDLSLVEKLGKEVNVLANNILYTKDNSTEQMLIDREYTMFECMKNKEYGFLLYDDETPLLITDNAMFYKAIYEHRIPKYDFFRGYFYQNDLGYMAHAIERTAEKNGIDTIYKPCSEIKNILKDMMISKWRNGNNTKQGIYPYLINKNKSLNEDSKVYYGLTIAAQARPQAKDEYLQPYNFSDFEFKTYKETDQKNWRDLLEALFPEQFKECTFYTYD